jgi:hypothetical protein
MDWLFAVNGEITHISLGAGTTNLRPSTLGAIGKSCRQPVVMTQNLGFPQGLDALLQHQSLHPPFACGNGGFALRANCFAFVVPTLAARSAEKMRHPEFVAVGRKQKLNC